jgi:hypothetical protein
VHHLQHHGEVEVDVEQLLFPLDADDSSGVKLKVLDFYLFHGVEVLLLRNCEKKTNFEEFA